MVENDSFASPTRLPHGRKQDPQPGWAFIKTLLALTGIFVQIDDALAVISGAVVSGPCHRSKQKASEIWSELDMDVPPGIIQNCLLEGEEDDLARQTQQEEKKKHHRKGREVTADSWDETRMNNEWLGLRIDWRNATDYQAVLLDRSVGKSSYECQPRIYFQCFPEHIAMQDRVVEAGW